MSLVAAPFYSCDVLTLCLLTCRKVSFAIYITKMDAIVLFDDLAS